MKKIRNLMKTFCARHLFRVGLAGLFLAVSATVGYGQINYTFNSSNDTTNWLDASQSVTVTPSFIAGDAPPGQALSTGSLGWTGTFDNAGHTFGGLSVSFPATDLTGYGNLEFDVKIKGATDPNGQIQELQPILVQSGAGPDGSTWNQSSVTIALTTVSTNNGWQHIVIPLNTYTNGTLGSTVQLMLAVFDANFTSATSVQLAFDNIQVTGQAPTGLTYYVSIFNSANDITNWQFINNFDPTVSSSFVPGDAPTNGPSTGCMEMSALFNTTYFKYEMAYRFVDAGRLSPALTNYNALEFDLKVGTNGAGQLSPLDSNGYNCQEWDWELVVNDSYVNGGGGNIGAPLTNNLSNNGWSHFRVPASAFGYSSGYFGGMINGMNVTNMYQVNLYPHDPNFPSDTTVYYKITNIKFTGPGATPIYSGLNSRTITYGVNSVILTGTVSDGNGNYLPSNTVVSVTINGKTQSTNIYDSTGDFTINYNLAGLPPSSTPYTITYSNVTDNVTFSAGSDSSTTLTFNKVAVQLFGTRAFDGTATASASILSVVNLVPGDSLTLSGSATLASSAVGTQPITDFSGLTLGGASAAGYTLVGASGSVSITASGPVTPRFSGLTSHTITYGATSVALTGIVSTNGTYPPNGTLITVTINGNAQTTTISDSTGDFSINYNTTGLPAGTYTVNYQSAVATGFNAASDSSTTLTVNKRPVALTGTSVYNGTTSVPASALSVINLIGSDSLTLSGSVGLASGNVGVETVASSGALTLGGSAVANYTAVGASGSVTVTPATLTYVATPTSQNFGSANTNFTGTVTGFLGSDTLANATTGTLAFTSRITPTSLGIWGITGSGLSAVNYVFVQAAGNATALMITPCGPVVALTNWVGIFNSDADTAGWVTSAGAAIGYFYPDAPPSGPSTGCLIWEAAFGGGNPSFNGISTNLPHLNVRNYTTLEMDIKNEGVYDRFSQIQAIQVNLSFGSVTFKAPDIQLHSPANSDWVHYSIPLSNFVTGTNVDLLTNVTTLTLNIFDGNFSTAATADIGFANIEFTGGQGVVPVFSNLSSKTIATGTTSVILTGKVGSCGAAYLPVNTPVTVTINGNTQTTAISDSTGDFNINYNTTGLANGTYPVTYSSAADNVVFAPATDTSTTLTVSSSAPPNSPTILPVSRDATGTNLVVRVEATQVGHNYYLLSTTSLTPPVIWSTNSITAGTGGTITNLVPISLSSPDVFFKYLVQ
ncbi:MAG TPA: YDG domain-containing protein [Verrucomicrobiae bacterium]|nr:YDG domain-containing protein [Verrucomicrobiae bacterium]